MASIVSMVGSGLCHAYSSSSTEINRDLRASGGGGRGRRSNTNLGGVKLQKRRMMVVRAAEGEIGINPAIRKTEEKVVDTVIVTELAKPLTPYCRCWRSGTFPLCDGSHVKHNKATGDNVGPLLLKKQ